MGNPTARIGGGFLALAAIWIGVYWLWEPSQNAKVSFASDPTAETGAVSAAAAAQEGQTPKSGAGLARSDASSESFSGTSQPSADEARNPVSETSRRMPSDSSSETTASVIPPTYRAYTVQKYDTFESISKKFYGTTRYAKAVIGANPYVNPTSLQVGRKLRVPIDPENIQGKPMGDDSTTSIDPEFAEYVVVKGDTLSEISQRFYGSMRYAKEIYKANISTMKSMDDLHVGQKLRIPSRSRMRGDSQHAETSHDE